MSGVAKDAPAVLDTVGAGVDAIVVAEGRGDAVGDAVLEDLFVVVEEVEFFHGDGEGDDVAGLGADGDALFFECGGVESRCQFGEESDLCGSGGKFFCHKCAGVDAALGGLGGGAH